MLDRFFSRPFILLGGIILVSLFLGFFATKVKPRSSLEANAVRSDPSYLLTRHIQKVFGASEETVSISIDSRDSLLTPKNLQTIERLRLDLERIPHVAQTLAITNLKRLDIGRDEINLAPLIPRPRTEFSRKKRDC
jgi:predicted RND superfamily exporter protein